MTSPRVTSLVEAQRWPALAVLSSIIHGNEPDGTAVTHAALVTADLIAERGGRSYHDITIALLNDASLKLLQEISMLSDAAIDELIKDSPVAKRLATHAETKGKAEGKAEGILVVLKARNIAVTTEQREQILSCQDPATLHRWLTHAALVNSTAEVLAPSGQNGH